MQDCVHLASGPATPDIFIPVTNLIESMNARLRKVTRNRGQFPSGQAALKVLYLAVRNLEEFRGPTVGTRSAGRKRHFRRSRSTSPGESRPHDMRHDHLHRRSDAPARDEVKQAMAEQLRQSHSKSRTIYRSWC